MVYNINLGIGWASSGVEYAQVYRAKMFRNCGIDAKFIFTDMITNDNIQIMTENIGFLDSEIIWLYTFFTDQKVAPVTYTLADLQKTFTSHNYTFSREGKKAKYVFPGNGNFYTCYMQDETTDLLHRVELVENGCLIRKDFFTYGRVFSEYYAPYEKAAHLYLRRFFNEDGTIAYEEIVDDDTHMYRFKDKILYSKEELIGYMISKLGLTKEDVVIIDRTTGTGQAILENVGDARVGIIIHADHFSEGSTNEDYILWNNYYEYAFAQWKHISFYVTATDAQNKLVREQFKKYVGVEPNVVTIPVGSLAKLTRPDAPRKKHALITASRLASEKHVDWLVKATAKVREVVPDVVLDIYGEGAEAKTSIKDAMEKCQCESYVTLCGQQKLDEVYKKYDAYFAGSTSEGFGLTLLEAVGSGLPIVGFDVRYGNQTFIDEGKNGYKIAINDMMSQNEKIDGLANAMIKMLTEDDMDAFHEHSYKIAETYLTSEVENRWKRLIMQTI